MAGRRCSVEDCDAPHYGLGYCRTHYRRLKATGSTELAQRSVRRCSVSGCDGKHYSLGLCNPHYYRQARTGTTDLRCAVTRSCTCTVCGSSFDRDPERLGGTPPRYCPTCKPDVVTGNKRRHAEARTLPPITTYECRYCDKPFTVETPDRRPRTTCPSCRGVRRVVSVTMYATRNPDQRRRTKAASQRRRRARKHTDTAEAVDLRTVCNRAGWRCALCGTGIDRELRYPDRMAASLDHIVPLSRGGEHTYANSQPAHWICNVRRGNRVEPVQVDVPGGFRSTNSSHPPTTAGSSSQ